jgi:hypothetical protein
MKQPAASMSPPWRPSVGLARQVPQLTERWPAAAPELKLEREPATGQMTTRNLQEGRHSLARYKLGKVHKAYREGMRISWAHWGWC